MVVFLLITIGCFPMLALSSNTNNTVVTKFVKGDYLCKLSERLKYKYSWNVQAGVISSNILCLSECSKHNDCKGASLDGSHQCFLHRITPGFMECGSDRELQHTYWEKYCVHGDWDPVSQSCHCVNFVSGKRCNVYLKTCKDLITTFNPPGFVDVPLDFTGSGKHPYEIKCHISPIKGYGVIIMRNKGMSFNRTWHDFQFGFKQDEYNLWAGLWNMYKVNIQKDSICQTVLLKVILTDKTWLKMFYFDFKVDGPDSLYTFNFKFTETYSTINLIKNAVFGDCLNDLKNVPFSTWDRDNDNVDGMNCASVRGSGWWLNGCDNVCNLMGWGIDDWANTKQEQRLSVGIDIKNLLSQISYIEIHLICDIEQ